jgi:glycosyltransferase involved in cell wall biosynthesis
MKSIIALTRYGSMGASSRVRFALYEDDLRRAGYALTLSPFFDDDYLRDLYGGRARSLGSVASAYCRRLRALWSAGSHDLLWVEKELLPFAPGLFERLIRLARTPYVVDFDDAIFHNYDQSGSALVRTLLSNKLDPLLAGSAAVTAGNRYLGDYASAHGARHVLTLPTVVNTAKYLYPASPTRRSSDKLIIGWIGSPATAPLLEKIVPTLNAAARQIPLKLVTIGIAPLANCEFSLETQVWSAESEVEQLGKIDVGMMPLTDSPFERGKCGYKLIQYMAVGKPVIASNVGVNGEIVSAEVGILAENEDEWIAAITRLWESPDLRAAMGAAGRERSEAHYSLHANAPRLIRLFDWITGGRPPPVRALYSGGHPKGPRVRPPDRATAA